MRTVLLIAYHFPPLVGSSGIQRTLRFAQYLPEFGWRAVVLAPQPAVYERIDPESVATVPPGCKVVRVPCLDTGRHLSLAGRYPRALALPDRWASWSWLGVPIGTRVCRRERVDVVWSTYPIATAHRIGAAVSRRTGLPWIADFRDPMAQDGYPEEPARWQAFKAIEEEAVRQAARLVFVTPSARDLYRRRYPDAPAERFVMIENGYDDSVFAAAQARVDGSRASGTPTGRTVLLHSGIVYPSERDPRALFEALGALKAAGAIDRESVLIRFRAPVHADLLVDLARLHDVTDLIEVLGPIPYAEAIAEMLTSDALLLMQGANCNEQIPAKLYEYMRAGRPVLTLADPEGDTGRRMTELGFRHIVRLESVEAVMEVLPRFLSDLHGGRAIAMSRTDSAPFSRRLLAGKLAALLEEARIADTVSA